MKYQNLDEYLVREVLPNRGLIAARNRITSRVTKFKKTKNKNLRASTFLCKEVRLRPYNEDIMNLEIMLLDRINNILAEERAKKSNPDVKYYCPHLIHPVYKTTYKCPVFTDVRSALRWRRKQLRKWVNQHGKDKVFAVNNPTPKASEYARSRN